MRYRKWVEQNLTGHEWLANGEVLVFCPYHHNEDTPACCVNIIKGVFYCYSCHEAGSLLTMAEHLGKSIIPVVELQDVKDAANKLRTRMEAPAPSDRLGLKSEAWLDQFTRRRHPYWRERGVTDSVRRDWKLGYDRNRDAVTIPLWSLNGSVMGVIRRYLDPETPFKYRYPVGFKNSLHLFGSHKFAREHLEGDNDLAVVVEGSIDCIRVWMAGFPCEALLGDSFPTTSATS